MPNTWFGAAYFSSKSSGGCLPAITIRCPLHGERFSKLAPTIYCSPDFITRVHLQPESWLAWHSPQYRKALKASFPPDRWPASEVTEPDGTVRFVLKDGTEIHRIGPPTEVYDYQTGKLIGRVGPRGRFGPTALDALAVFTREIYQNLVSYWQVFRPHTADKCWPAQQIFTTIKREFSRFGWEASAALTNFASGDKASLLTCLGKMQNIKPHSGYPIMAVSKFLHFYNPTLFPI